MTRKRSAQSHEYAVSDEAAAYIADALMELALQFEATHFAHMDQRCCCPSSCLADIAAARCYSPLRSAASLPTFSAAEQSDRSDLNSASM
jgi:hypothetical protein